MDGIIIINKPKNNTSHDIVRKAKKILNEKVGHTGTLDPMATGVLPLLIGKGTLCSKYLINHDKIYEVQLTLGTKTDTADGEGKILQKEEIPKDIFQKEKLCEILQSFIGKQEQRPPMYSAIKIKGKKLYEYARKGEMVDIPLRIIEIYHIKLLAIDSKNKQIKFQVACSKGTYIRSLCEDIAQRLHTIGYMSSLTRMQVGEFDLTNAIKVEELENDNQVQAHFITIEKLFQKKPEITLDPKRQRLFLNGVKITIKKADGIYRIYANEKFLGMGIVENQCLKRDIILEE